MRACDEELLHPGRLIDEMGKLAATQHWTTLDAPEQSRPGLAAEVIDREPTPISLNPRSTGSSSACCREPVVQAFHDANIQSRQIDRLVFVGGPTRMPMRAAAGQGIRRRSSPSRPEKWSGPMRNHLRVNYSLTIWPHMMDEPPVPPRLPPNGALVQVNECRFYFAPRSRRLLDP